ncbi:hypothetical protein M378DRAFT_1015901 [Amanita muscaria Koide BX008]|uniref:Uncharacterized protein n=1 Tax=Amanita muscaria (strain Koide BX008) TaxID=946122 RepID=A0A0C2S8Y5_AMAMK|nr:hypothetical protein M378DRAFT_1015901 [Amanita muscaria Koide BX008]
MPCQYGCAVVYPVFDPIKQQFHRLKPCWPSASDFSNLASRLSQPLIRPTPPASACYPPSHPSGDCTDVLAHLDDGPWRDNLPGAMQSINFESFTFDNGTINACYYNTTLGYPCDQGNIPIIGVDARTVGDIQAGVSFAAKHNLKLVIKNTGHDYLGRSMARGGFMLWTHNLKNITYNERFVQDGAPSNSPTYQALTLGGVSNGVRLMGPLPQHVTTPMANGFSVNIISPFTSLTRTIPPNHHGLSQRQILLISQSLRLQ